MNGVNISEAETRKKFIDEALEHAGWSPIVPFQENSRYVHGSVEEYPTERGPADYILFHEGKALACVEGKKVAIGHITSSNRRRDMRGAFRLEITP